MAYSFLDISIKAEFEVENIYKLNSKSGVNEHTTLELECSLKKDEKLKELTRDDNNTNIKLILNEDGKLLFNGTIKKILSFNRLGENILRIYAVGLSENLDRERKKRLFKGDSLENKDIAEHIVSEHFGKLLSKNENDNSAYIALQYGESDWEFIKRIAAREEKLIIPAELTDRLRIYFGIPDIEVEIEYKEILISGTNSEGCITRKDRDRGYIINGKWHIFLSEENYGIGSIVNIYNEKYIIVEKEVEYINGFLQFKYRVCKKDKIKALEKYNSKITGILLDGTVKKCEADELFVKFDIESDTSSNKVKLPWLPVTGNTMYCMPEEDTKVKVYFGDCDERKNVFVLESISNGFVSERGIITKALRIMQLGDKGVNFKTKSSVKTSGKNIDFSSSEKLLILSEKDIKVKAELMTLISKTDIEFIKK